MTVYGEARAHTPRAHGFISNSRESDQENSEVMSEFSWQAALVIPRSRTIAQLRRELRDFPVVAILGAPQAQDSREQDR